MDNVWGGLGAWQFYRHVNVLFCYIVNYIKYIIITQNLLTANIVSKSKVIKGVKKKHMSNLDVQFLNIVML